MLNLDYTRNTLVHHYPYTKSIFDMFIYAITQGLKYKILQISSINSPIKKPCNISNCRANPNYYLIKALVLIV